MINQPTIHQKSQFIFKKITPDDLPLLYSWFKQPHVQQWWPVPTKEEFFEKFLRRIRSKDTFPFLVFANGIPFAYIQYYYIDRTEPKAGKWLPELPETTVGTDQFIGDPAFLAKGYGTAFIKAFIDYLPTIEPHITTVIVDPEPTNITAIRCYEKVGFKKVGNYTTEFGDIVLMRYDLAKKKKSMIDDELLDLVNEHDQIIGQEWRSVVHEQGLRNFRVVNAFLINQQSQLWIPRRTAHKKLFPSALDASMGGHVASGETYEQAFSRELMEELRIDAKQTPFHYIGSLNPYEHNTSGFMQVFMLHTNNAPEFNTDDFLEYYWLTPREFFQRIANGDSCKSDLPKIIRHLFL